MSTEERELEPTAGEVDHFIAVVSAVSAATDGDGDAVKEQWAALLEADSDAFLQELLAP